MFLLVFDYVCGSFGTSVLNYQTSQKTSLQERWSFQMPIAKTLPIWNPLESPDEIRMLASRAFVVICAKMRAYVRCQVGQTPVTALATWLPLCLPTGYSRLPQFGTCNPTPRNCPQNLKFPEFLRWWNSAISSSDRTTYQSASVWISKNKQFPVSVLFCVKIAKITRFLKTW